MSPIKSFVLTLLLAVALCSASRAQDSTRVQRYEYVIGATIAYSLFDWVGWNLDVNINNNPVWIYRSVQILTQAAISYFLYKTCGLSSSVAFNLIWWTWGDDLAFYGYQYAFNVGHPWPNRTYRDDIGGNQITWAGWTPIGLLRPQGSTIARNALFGQAAIGLTVALGILW